MPLVEAPQGRLVCSRAKSAASFFTVLLSALLSWTRSVRAEQDAGVPEEPVAGPLTEVINVRGSRPSGAAQTSVVDAERFAGEAPTVAELLATSPGVSVQRSGGPGQAAFVSLRARPAFPGACTEWLLGRAAQLQWRDRAGIRPASL